MTQNEANIVYESLYCFEVKNFKIKVEQKPQCACEDECECYYVTAEIKGTSRMEVHKIEDIPNFGYFVFSTYNDYIEEKIIDTLQENKR